MANGIRTGNPCGFNKGCSSKFCVGSWVWQTPEEGNNNEDEDKSPKTLNDKNHQASSQKFRQPIVLYHTPFRIVDALTVSTNQNVTIAYCMGLTYTAGMGLIKNFELKILTGLVWFSGISTIVGYLMPNLVYTYILDIYDSVLFLTIQFSISHLLQTV